MRPISKERVAPALGLACFATILLVFAFIVPATDHDPTTTPANAALMIPIVSIIYGIAYGVLTRDRPFSKHPPQD